MIWITWMRTTSRRPSERGRARSPRSRALRHLAAAAGALALLLPAPAAAEDGPRAVVTEITDQVLGVLRASELSTDEKRERIERIVYAHVDFDTVARLVLARNWQRFSPAQRAEFVEQFKQHLSHTYGRNVETYRNERVTIVGDRAEVRGDWTVQTKVLRPSGQDVLVDYRLRRHDDAWRIIDIIIERVSLVSNFRSQFQGIVARGGPDRLIELLREKNAKGEPLES
jgi:phospholipid transport system substrate-binding protein